MVCKVTSQPVICCLRGISIEVRIDNPLQLFKNEPVIDAANNSHAILKTFIHTLIFREIHAYKAYKYGSNTLGHQLPA